MDEHLTDGYCEPCGQCGAVDWGVSDGGNFFCKNCHNVIEKTRHLVDFSLMHSKTSRISDIKKPKRKKSEDEREWMICEGFQLILKHQAKALVSLGVCMKFETEVLWNFWKRYLQNTHQAFTSDPVYTPRFTVYMMDKNEPESDTQSELSYHSSDAASNSELMSVSGHSSAPSSAGSEFYNHSFTLMNMPRTLALCYLALLWVREAITLSDLLRMVSDRLIPYVDVYNIFPEEMRLFGRDVQIFRVWNLPSYPVIHKEVLNLAQIMKLPSFPTVSKDCLLHPLPLTVRYLLDANLPNALHVWVDKVIRGADIDDEVCLTFDPSREKPRLMRYDIQAVAAIIVTLKLLFKLDDHEEWKLPKEAPKEKKKKKVFRIKRWFDVVQPVLEKARENEEREIALRSWKTTNPVITSLQRKSLLLKKRRVADYLEQRFQKLTNSTPQQLPSTTNHPSSFRFNWGNAEGSDGPSMHNSRLDCTIKKNGVRNLTNRRYWHPELKICYMPCGYNHYTELEPWLPRMYVWVLDLFSFILGVHQAEVHKEVLDIERRFFNRNHQSKFEWTYNSLIKKKHKSKTPAHVAKQKITDISVQEPTCSPPKRQKN